VSVELDLDVRIDGTSSVGTTTTRTEMRINRRLDRALGGSGSLVATGENTTTRRDAPKD
jgi:hypothetical protein